MNAVRRVDREKEALSAKRVLIVVENLPVPFDRRVWNEATSLARHGYQVTVICPTGKGYETRYEELEGVTIYRHPLPLEGSGPLGYFREYFAALFWETALAFKVLRSRGFDAIHACNPPDLIFLIALLFKPFGKKFVFDHHDINPELYFAKFGRKDAFYSVLLVLERLTFKVADISLATNESYKRIAVTRGKMEPARVYVVRSGPNLAKWSPVAPRDDLKRGRRFLVGYVGVMGKQEGVNYLLDAAKIIVQDRGRSDVGFVIIGGGTEAEVLQQYANEKKLSDDVLFTGRVPDDVLIEYVCTADVCVNPDEANEMNDKSTMNKIMEYMALGKPIVQFDLTEGRASALEASAYAKRNDAEDLADKIIELLDDPERRARMGAFGRARIEAHLSWEHSEKVLVEAYEDLFAPA